jgi:hypothetical protein
MKMLQGNVSYDSDAVNRTDAEYAFFRGADTVNSGSGTSVFYDPNASFLRKVIKDPPIGDSFVNFDNINGNDPYPQTANSDYAVRIRQSGVYAIHAQFAVSDTTRNLDFFASSAAGSGVIKMVRFEIIVRQNGSGNMLSPPAVWNEGQNLYRTSNLNYFLTAQGHSTVHMIQYINNNTFITGQLRWFSSTTSVNKQTGAVKEPSATGVTPLNANYFSLEFLKGA